jgi:hypothetical protein
MSIPIIAAVIALIGAVGLVASALAHAGPLGDLIFMASTFCLVGAPLIFLGWFFIQAGREIARTK